MTSKRPPITLAVLVDDDRRRPKEFVAALADQFQSGDAAVLLGPGHSAAHAASWRIRRPNGALERPSKALRPAETIIVIDDRVMCSPGLIGTLVDAAQDQGLGAVAPRTNFASGDELYVGVPYGPGDVGGRRAFLRAIAERELPATTEVARLQGPCVLVRREDLDSVGGLEALRRPAAITALFKAIRASRRALAVAEHAYVHHPGGPRRGAVAGESGLVSACLIIKDEAHQLEACMLAARELADEIVIYDTGSSDNSIELARSLGAQVIEGYWDEDFARARNEALLRCRGEWILWVDADEQLVCPNPRALRALLSRASTDVDGFLVPVDNLQGTEAGTVLTHPAARLFRRASAHWEGRLHEQIIPIARQGGAVLAFQDLARLTHRGYLQHAMRERDKGNRNLRSAFGDLAGGSELDAASRILSLARSYMLAGRYEEGRELCVRALELADRDSTKRLGLRALGEALLSLGRFGEVLDVAARIRTVSRIPVLADIFEGQAHLGLGEPEEALACYARVGHARDDDGFEYRPDLVAGGRAQALIALERWSDAADVLLTTLRESDGLDGHVGRLVELLRAAGRDVCEILDAIRPERRVAFVPQIVQLHPQPADEVLEAWHAHDPASLPILAAAAQVALSLPIERKLVWSARLRAAGLFSSCPLAAAAAASDVTPHARALCAAIAHQSFGDARATLAFRAAALAVPAELRGDLALQIAAISPPLAEELERLPVGEVPAAPTGPRAATRHQVVIFSTLVGDLSAIAYAAAAASAGHAVTVVHPAPWAPTDAVLRHLAVTVRGWVGDGGEKDMRRSALRAAARLYAEQPYDVVVLSAELDDLVADFRRLFPVAELVHLAEPTAVPPIDIAALYGAGAPIPPESRSGIVLVSDWEVIAPDTARAVEEQILPALGKAIDGRPVVVIGHDPGGQTRKALPQALIAGPAPDPTPWLRAARAVVLAGAARPALWASLAAQCAVPLIELDPASEPSEALTALANSLSATAITGAPTHRSVRPSDPLAGAPVPYGARTRARPSAAQPVVYLRSSVYSLDSLAQVNRELARELARGVRPFSLEVVTPEPSDAPAERRAQLEGVNVHHGRSIPAGGAVEIRHQWPPDFSPSSAARLVLMQPFEYGGLPAEWIGPLRDVVDELWVPTSWVRDCAIQSGVDAEKVHLVPYGIDTERFRPDGPTYPLATKKATRFLFVGGCIHRKGVDILLESYLTTFSADDDVCLVIKPYGTDSVYRNSSLEQDIRRAAAGNGAEIEFIDSDLGFEDLAALYRSCTALVHPYRGEGFGLTIAEAMACGIPVVVPNGGACLDFCDDSVGWMLDARVVTANVGEFTASKAGWWWLEPSREHLANALREIAADPELARRRGAVGRTRIVASFTWAHAARAAADRLARLLQ